jgi:hypothetical protein
MLRLAAVQAETLWDEALPIEVRQLPTISPRSTSCCAIRR